MNDDTIGGDDNVVRLGRVSHAHNVCTTVMGKHLSIPPTVTNCIILGVGPAHNEPDHPLLQLAARLGIPAVDVEAGVDSKVLLCSRVDPGEASHENPHFDFFALIDALLDRMDRGA